MSRQHPFSLHIFVVDGDPDGLRIVERSNWNGKALVFPRSTYPRIKARDEFSQTGVYLLLGQQESGEGEALYVGEGDPVRPRLDSHFAKKDFWTKAVFFVGGVGKLNKAHVQFLESQLVTRAKAAKRATLDNGNGPAEPTLSEADRAVMEVFLDNMLGMLPVLGVQAFERPDPALRAANGLAPTDLACRGRGVTAFGYEGTAGFVVRNGSEAVSLGDEAPSLEQHVKPVHQIRRELVDRRVLVADGSLLRFVQDYTFTSPSLAAAVVLGCSSNGRTAWRDSGGRTLKRIQEFSAPVEM